MEERLSDMDKFLELLREVGQEFDDSKTTSGYDIECLTDGCNICIEFDEEKRFKGITPMI